MAESFENKRMLSLNTIISEIEKKVKVESFTFMMNPVRKTTIYNNDGITSDKYSAICSIYLGKCHLADIYDLSQFDTSSSNLLIETAYNNALTDDEAIPYYLFFYNDTSWKGLFVGFCNDKKENRIRFFDPMQNYYNNASEKCWTTSVNDIAFRLMNCNNVFLGKSILQDMKDKIEKWFHNHDKAKFKSRVHEIIESWLYTDDSVVFSNSKFHLSQNKEDKLFIALLGCFNSKYLYRYVNNKGLGYVVKDGEHAMSSIVCMNDSTECYYSNNYLWGEGNVSKEDRQLSFLLNYENYITSLSTCMPSDLTMWRLYGDEAKGAVLTFDLEESNLPPNFIMAPVSYPEDDGTHLELDFVKYLLSESFYSHKLILMRWAIWQRFFKPLGFKVEKEVRLLYSPQTSEDKLNKWIFANGIYSPLCKFTINKNNGEAKTPLFPLQICKIILGPKFPEPEVNEILIEQRMKSFGIKIKVSTSDIDYYRAN